MKILFLDVDGVLNCQNDFKLAHEESKSMPYSSTSNDIINTKCVENLANIIFPYKTILPKFALVDLVVLSSTWRIAGEGSLHMQTLRRALLRYDIHIHSITPRLFNKPRGLEIKSWFNDNNVDPNKTDYVILDDDPDMLELQLPHFVRTSFEEDGLNKSHVDKALEILRFEMK